MSNTHITPVLAAGSVASPYLFQVNISQTLCHSTCAAQAPVFTPAFTLVGYSLVGEGAYMATINVQGVISYTPCRGNQCCTINRVVNSNFTIPFASAAAPTSVTIAAGAAVNSVAASACHDCSRAFVSEIPLTLTIATAG